MAVAEPITNLMSSAQVGRRLGVSPARIRALRREGRLPGISTALGHLHHVSAVEALERERAHRGDAASAPTAVQLAPAVVDEPSSPFQAQVLGFLQASAGRTQARSAFISKEDGFQ